MKIQRLVLAMLLCFAVSLYAQQADSTQQIQRAAPKKAPAASSKVYYGGSVGLSFGSYFRISLSPMVGYKLSPKASIGARVGYEYIEDKRYSEKLTSSNYGGSVFTRYRVHPRIYAHAEFAYMSYKFKTGDVESTRDWVPFLLLGGGYIQPISPRASLIVEVLVDVLRDSNSPYDSWEPFVSVGVGVGL